MSKWMAIPILLSLLSSPVLQSNDRYIQVNGVRIHYLEWGTPDKQPMILLHGIGRVAHTFETGAPAVLHIEFQ